MQRIKALGVGALCLVLVTSCGSDKSPESKVGQNNAGGGGAGGAAGSLSLGQDGGGGSGGAGGASGASTAGAATAGTTSGGATASAGSGGGASAGNTGSGGGQAVEPCQRAPSFDADCADLFDDLPQAYTCGSLAAASMLRQMHDGTCGSISLAGAGKYNECCSP